MEKTLSGVMGVYRAEASRLAAAIARGGGVWPGRGPNELSLRGGGTPPIYGDNWGFPKKGEKKGVLRGY